MSSVPPATAAAVSGKGHRITAQLSRQGTESVFQLSFGGDTILLRDSLALNRWTAVGIVTRHQLSVSHEGVIIDSHQIQYTNPQATQELERILNRPEATPHPRPAHS